VDVVAFGLHGGVVGEPERMFWWQREEGKKLGLARISIWVGLKAGESEEEVVTRSAWPWGKRWSTLLSCSHGGRPQKTKG
jgi:hypothetical protein